MIMGPPAWVVSSAAGAHLSPTAGSESERAQKDALAQNRQADAIQRAERAAGIGQTEQDQESSERDGDGRRLWETPGNAAKGDKGAGLSDGPVRQSKDATGQAGTKLDLTR